MKKIIILTLLLIPMVLISQHTPKILNGHTLKDIKERHPEGEVVKYEQDTYYKLTVEDSSMEILYVIVNEVCTHTVLIDDLSYLPYLIQDLEEDANLIKLDTLHYAHILKKHIVHYRIIPDYELKLVSVFITIE